ncbi:colony stimulating factor 1 (macrophage), isoform CRA_a [Rattus norvegicus]|uniref:Colony stimulating factor 1 (Macrophage), isoform CRA_a n=1 Tax=Rattus norvegicus TaxID=10116 RepID=A6HUV0_RAT|nr:colony stimulating factor 1 (macrophage), isoform CRA_a [Rattus norvegicus]
MTARGAAGRCPSSTWMGSRLLLVSLPGYWVANLSGHGSGGEWSIGSTSPVLRQQRG